MSVKLVKKYSTVEEFNKGLDKAQDDGWILHSWQVVASGSGVIIIAVYRGQ